MEQRSPRLGLPSGFSQSPDATFTLRLSYGAVKGYQENGKTIPFATNIGGAYQHAAEHGDKAPYQLPESWMKAKSSVDQKAPLNLFLRRTSSETIRIPPSTKGDLWDSFDGNIESLPWNFVSYSDSQGRAVSVDSRGIQESLRKIYSAGALADELTGKTASAAAGK